MKQASRTTGETGFTLIEMMVVIAILALAATAIVPAFFNPSAQRSAGQTAMRLVAGIREARAAAIGRNTETAFIVDAAARRYWSDTGGRISMQNLPEGIAVNMIVAASERPSATSGKIRFFPDGASSGATLIISSGQTKSIVTVDWLTGRTQIERNLPGS